VYQLAVIEGAPKLIRGMIISGMKNGAAENLRPYFIPVVHNEADLKKLVSYKEEDDAYIVVLDRSGKVTYQTHGAAPDSSYAEFRTKVQGLLK
jgi:predicted transcriptional regulator